MLGKPRILSLFPTRLINSIKHEHSCKILYLSFQNVMFMHMCIHFSFCCCCFAIDFFFRNLFKFQDNMVAMATADEYTNISSLWKFFLFMFTCSMVDGETVLYDFLVTVKAAPHECVIRTGLP